ncbi:hypothetical protein BH09PAT4_BH09PAT4_00680 [soil metagenome]
MIAIPLAGCVITNRAGKVLLIHRNTPELTQWELPGGKLEPGESFMAAAVREVHEEARVRVTIVRELGDAAFVDRGYTWDYHWFLATIDSGEPQVGESNKFDGIQYMDLATVNQDEISINVINLIKAIKNGTVTL